MSMSVHLVVQQVNRGAAYLWNPPCDSWVSSFASLFFLLAVLVASPLLLLLALDFTSYAIVRTLGIPYAHPTSSKPSTIPSSPVTPSPTGTISPSPSSLSLNSPSVLTQRPKKQKKKPSQISITLGPLEVPSQPQEYFTTPSERNLALAGVGVFSPPHSRTPSPPITRKNTASNILSTGLKGVASFHGLLGVGTDSGDKKHEEGDRERLPVNGQGNDSSDDDADPLSTLRRRKATGLATPPESSP